MGFLEHELCFPANSTWNAAITIHVQMLSHWRHPTLLPQSPPSFMPQGITCSQRNHTSISSDCFPWKDDFLMLYKTMFPSRGITSRSFLSSLFHPGPSSHGFLSDSWFQGSFSLPSTKQLLNKTEKLHLSLKKKKRCLDPGLHSKESKASLYVGKK